MTHTLEPSLSRAADGIQLIREVAQSGTDEEIRRLQAICAQLVATITSRQHNFASEIERFIQSPVEAKWNSIQHSLEELATEVSRMFKLLAREAGEFTIERQDTFRNLVEGLADRQSIYRELERLTYPLSDDDLAYLRTILREYRRLRDSLVEAEREIADYLRSRKELAKAPSRQTGRTEADRATAHLVVLVHGIRDRARWHDEISRTLRAEGLVVEPTTHGRMNLIEFLLPIPYFRRRAYDAVLTQLRHAKTLHPDCGEVSVIAHSFGTYVVSKILEREADLKFHRIIFCGNVVSWRFPFQNYATRFTPSLLNDVGTADPWPAIAESVTFGYGSAGTFGFNRPGVQDRYFAGEGHGHFLTRDFCTTYWLPFLRDGTVVEGGANAARPLWVELVSIVKVKWIMLAAAAGLLAWRLLPAALAG